MALLDAAAVVILLLGVLGILFQVLGLVGGWASGADLGWMLFWGGICVVLGWGILVV